MNEYRAPRINEPQGSHWAVKAEPEVLLSGVELQGTSFFGFASTMNKGLVRSYVEVGRYCSIGRGVTLGLGFYDSKLPSTSAFFSWPAVSSTMRWAAEKPKRRVIVGHDVRIGDGVRIESGVTIGTGAIIAAGAVVEDDVPPYAIASGTPAKICGWRFAEDERKLLLDSEWWTYEPSELQKYMCPDPLDFVTKLNVASPPRYQSTTQDIFSER